MYIELQRSSAGLSNQYLMLLTLYLALAHTQTANSTESWVHALLR